MTSAALTIACACGAPSTSANRTDRASSDPVTTRSTASPSTATTAAATPITVNQTTLTAEGTGHSELDVSQVRGDADGLIALYTRSAADLEWISVDASGNEIERYFVDAGSEGLGIFHTPAARVIVDTDADWTLEFRQLADMARFDRSGDGRGDHICIYTGPGGTATITHTTTGRIDIYAIRNGQGENLVGDAGQFTKQVTIPAGPFVLVIATGATDAWSFTVE